MPCLAHLGLTVQLRLPHLHLRPLGIAHLGRRPLLVRLHPVLVRPQHVPDLLGQPLVLLVEVVHLGVDGLVPDDGLQDLPLERAELLDVLRNAVDILMPNCRLS